MQPMSLCRCNPLYLIHLHLQEPSQLTQKQGVTLSQWKIVCFCCQVQQRRDTFCNPQPRATSRKRAQQVSSHGKWPRTLSRFTVAKQKLGTVVTKKNHKKKQTIRDRSLMQHCILFMATRSRTMSGEELLKQAGTVLRILLFTCDGE